MIAAFTLFALGLFLSAFFSGTETGFYRATRVRLRLDAMSGDVISRGLIWLANNPALFVGTTLIGNNLANFLTSFAIVMGCSAIVPGNQGFLAAAAPVILSPLVFVYGELFPKNLFFQAPNRLLRFGGPMFLFCSVIFLPASFVLWLLGRALRFLVGSSPERLRLSLARQELQQVFDEGQEVGILRPTQWRLAQGMLSLAHEPLVRFTVPLTTLISVRRGTPKQDVFRVAARNNAPLVLVTEPNRRRIIGYARMVDLQLGNEETLETFGEWLVIHDHESPLSALMLMQSRHVPIAAVTDAQGETLGLLTTERLVEAMGQAQLAVGNVHDMTL